MSLDNDGEDDTLRLYAWLARDLDGTEGVIAVPTAYGFMPLVVTSREVALSMESFARESEAARGHPARLVVFERGRTLRSTRRLF